MADENEQDEQEQDCPICFDVVGKSHAVMCQNNHKICGRCLMNMVSVRQKIKCPVCRGDSEFPVEQVANDQRMLYYTQQKRNRYLSIGSRRLQVEIQGKRLSELRMKQLLGSAANLICHMLKQQSEEDGEQVLSFTNEQIDVELCLIRDILTINF